MFFNVLPSHLELPRGSFPMFYSYSPPSVNLECLRYSVPSKPWFADLFARIWPRFCQEAWYHGHPPARQRKRPASCVVPRWPLATLNFNPDWFIHRGDLFASHGQGQGIQAPVSRDNPPRARRGRARRKSEAVLASRAPRKEGPTSSS